eukprot:746654-Prymnesium_polylepis.1
MAAARRGRRTWVNSGATDTRHARADACMYACARRAAGDRCPRVSTARERCEKALQAAQAQTGAHVAHAERNTRRQLSPGLPGCQQK